MKKSNANLLTIAIAGVSVIVAAVMFGVGFEIGRVGADRGIKVAEQHGIIPKEYNARTVFVSR